MELFLIRHTSVDIEPGTCYGQADVSLSKTFDEERQIVKQKLAGIEKPVMFASPLSRTKALAEFLMPGRVYCEKRLMELNFGKWELQNWDEITDAHKDTFLNDFVNHKPPGGESFRNMSERVMEFFNAIFLQDYEYVFVVTHGGTIRCLLADILEMPLKNIFSVQLDYGSITHISMEKQWARVRYING